MKTSLVFALIVVVAPLVARGASAPPPAPPTSCDARVEIEVRKKGDAKAALAKIAAAARKLRAAPEVRLRGRGLDAATLTALGRDPALAGVATLGAPCLGEAALRALLAPGVFPGLTRLDIQGCRVDERIGAALGGIAARDAIAKLDLGRGQTNAAALKALLAIERHAPLMVVVSGLRSLPTAALAEVGRVAPNAAVTFSVAVRCGDLGRLDRTGFLRHVSRIAVACGDSGATLLARSANTAALRSLEIDACSGDDDEADYVMTRDAALTVVEAPALAGVVELAFRNDLEACEQPGIGRAGLADVLSAAFAPRLRALELSRQSLGRKGVALVVSTERLPALSHLVLGGERLSQEDVRALAQTGPLAARLDELALPGVDVDEEGGALDDATAGALASSLTMPKLRRLDVTRNSLSRGTRDRLRRAPWAAALELMDVAAPGEGASASCGASWRGPDVALDPE